MAVPAYQTRGADDRCKEGHGRITRCPVLEGVAIQTGLSRSLGNPARNVTGKIKSLSKAGTQKIFCFLLSCVLQIFERSPRNSRTVPESSCVFSFSGSFMDWISWPGFVSPNENG